MVRVALELMADDAEAANEVANNVLFEVCEALGMDALPLVLRPGAEVPGVGEVEVHSVQAFIDYAAVSRLRVVACSSCLIQNASATSLTFTSLTGYCGAYGRPASQ
jgi:hypothetical protein